MVEGFRILVLFLLIVQNSIYTLLRRFYSSGSSRDLVSFPVILLVTEVVKFVVSAGLVELPAEEHVHCTIELETWMQRRRAAVRRALRASIPMAVPALTYAIMNMVSYKALELIDATVFAMVAQLKIVSTALFSWPVLGRKQSQAQWQAIMVLTLAVTIITYQRGSQRQNGVQASFSLSFVVGVVLTLIEIILSGWINTYFERYLKDGCFSVWGRNLQLSFWSILVYICVQMPSADADLLAVLTVHDVFAQFFVGARALLRPVPVMLVILGGGGGLLVAFAIKHADAVLKSMATAFSLVIVVGGEVVLLGAGLDPVILMASAVAVLGIQIYQDAPKMLSASTITQKADVTTTPEVTPKAMADHVGQTPRRIFRNPDKFGTVEQMEEAIECGEALTSWRSSHQDEAPGEQPTVIGR